MKKVILSVVIVMFGLFLFSSCDLNEQQVKELEKYGYTQTRAGDGDINHDEIGDEVEEDDDLDLEIR